MDIILFYCEYYHAFIYNLNLLMDHDNINIHYFNHINIIIIFYNFHKIKYQNVISHIHYLCANTCIIIMH